jgi:alcohol dehydrogenase class IV
MIRKLGEIARELGKSVLVVGYRDHSGMEETYRRAEEALRNQGVTVAFFHEVHPDPEADLAKRGAERALEVGADVIVGLGGGSVIDAAKGIAALAKMGGSTWDYAGANPDSRRVTQSLPLVAVPTTAGTGSEVTGVAVFTHRGVGSSSDVPLKASISGPAVRPTVALVDPDLATGSPASLTAVCGADALGHAMEACMSRRANPVSTVLGIRAVSLIVGNLHAAVEEPNDPQPREPLALAATLAGVAFAEAGVVVTHAVAQALGGVLHVSHGLGVAIGTPLTLRFNRSACTDLYAQLADACDVSGKSSAEKAEKFVDTVTELLRTVGIPDRVEVPGGPTEELIQRLVVNARESTPIPITLNPRKVDHAALVEMFRQVLI